MKPKRSQPKKGDGQTAQQSLDTDVQTLAELIQMAIGADPSGDGARIGGVVGRVTCAAADDVEVAEVGMQIDRMVREGELKREDGRLYKEAER